MERNDEGNRAGVCRFLMIWFLVYMLLSSVGDSKSQNLRDSDEIKRMKEVKRKLGEKLDIDYKALFIQKYNYPYNISGIYMGKWRRDGNATIILNNDIHFGAHHDLVRLPSNSSVKGNEGLLSLQFYHRDYLRDNIHVIDAILTLIEGEQDTSEDSFSLNLVGLYFIPTGKIELYGHTYGSRLYVDWKSTPASANITIDNSFEKTIGYSKNNTNRVFLTSPKIYSSESTSKCFYSLSMQLKELDKSIDPEISHHEHSKYMVNATGLFQSENCDSGLWMEMGGYNIDTAHITTKVRVYTVVVLIASFLECILYIYLFQHFTTTSAVSFSFATIYLMIAIDLLLAMSHSVVSVFFMGILSELYLVVFHKFFVISVIEMRLFYIVWHSRHPVITNENIRALQRQLSALYISLYILTIGTLVGYYLNISLFKLLLFVLYSFWVPQIIRSLSMKQRCPLSVKQIVYLTLLKLVIPCYIFCCPYNLIETFTDNTIHYSEGRLLIMWVLIQVGFLYFSFMIRWSSS